MYAHYFHMWMCVVAYELMLMMIMMMMVMMMMMMMMMINYLDEARKFTDWLARRECFAPIPAPQGCHR